MGLAPEPDGRPARPTGRPERPAPGRAAARRGRRHRLADAPATAPATPRSAAIRPRDPTRASLGPWPGGGRGPKGRFLLWVDAVGGYLVCLDDRIILGRAGPDSPADVPLMGDLSRNHATLVRGGESYMLQAHHATFVNGKPVTDRTALRDGDVIRLGSTVELEFRQPSPVSADGPAGDRQPAPPPPRRRRRAPDGRDLHRRRHGPGPHPGRLTEGPQ